MMNKYPILSALFLGGIVFAAADDPSSREAPLPRFLRQLDTNRDGIIDEEERQAISDLRAKLRETHRDSIDENRDGRISRREAETARRLVRAKIEERRLEKFREIAGEDDLISPEEFATVPGSGKLPDFVFQGIFDRLDRDASGDISMEEFSHRLTPRSRRK